MREEVLRRFFQRELSVIDLVADLSGTVTRIDSADSAIAVEDMIRSFRLERSHILLLCDAALAGTLPYDDLNTIAFALLASDQFEWDGDEDEVLVEVLYDWSAPEINFPLNAETVKMHQSWLREQSETPQKPPLEFPAREGKVVSRRTKVPASADPRTEHKRLVADLRGAMRGTVRIAPRVDLTEPNGEVWDADSE